MTVHHLPKPIPDGDPNHQSRNFLVPGRSTPRPSHSCTPTCRGSQRGAGGGGRQGQTSASLEPFSATHSGDPGGPRPQGFCGSWSPSLQLPAQKVCLGRAGTPSGSPPPTHLIQHHPPSPLIPPASEACQDHLPKCPMMSVHRLLLPRISATTYILTVQSQPHLEAQPPEGWV